MAHMTWSGSMQALRKKLATAFPEVTYSVGTQFCWSPETREVFYDPKAPEPKGSWSLLHETGHALLDHRTWQADYELLQMEIAAWERARALADEFDVALDEDHIQDCLDTYRDWLYQRSLCPTCSTQCMQTADLRHYRCHNCHTVWRVSADRFTRTYRKLKQFS